MSLQPEEAYGTGSTSDEDLLAQSLTLNDNLQHLIAKHDTIASGSPLPENLSESNPKPGVSSAPVATAAHPHKSEEEDDDPGFSQLAHRKSKGKSVFSQSSSVAIGDEEVSFERSALVATEAAPSDTSALNLPDPTPSVNIDTKEQDLIDLLSITLSTNPSSPLTQPTDTPVAPSSASYGTGSHVPDHSAPGNSYNQSDPANQGYTSYNSYVVPWAQQTLPQPVPQPQFPHYSYYYSYPPPPWATQSNGTDITSVNQYPTSQASPSN